MSLRMCKVINMIKNYKRLSNLTVADPIQFEYESRYKTYYRIIDLNNNDAIFESPNKFNLSQTINKYHVVESVEEGRLDLISQIYYGDSQYFWVIAMANNIIDPLTVIQGTILKIPDLNSLYFKGSPLESRR